MPHPWFWGAPINLGSSSRLQNKPARWEVPTKGGPRPGPSERAVERKDSEGTNGVLPKHEWPCPPDSAATICGVSSYALRTPWSPALEFRLQTLLTWGNLILKKEKAQGYLFSGLGSKSHDKYSPWAYAPDWVPFYFFSCENWSLHSDTASTILLRHFCCLPFVVSFLLVFNGTNGVGLGASSQSTVLLNPTVGHKEQQCLCAFSRTRVLATELRHCCLGANGR